MSVRQACDILRAVVQEVERAFEKGFGSRTLSAAQDLASLLENRLCQESLYVSIWGDFQADPEGTAPELIGALEAWVEPDPALG